MSAPWRMSFSTSSLSPAAHAERKTHPSENWILLESTRAEAGSLFVSDSSHLLSCSALLNRAELVLDSMFLAAFQRNRKPPSSATRALSDPNEGIATRSERL